jgi:membrane-bound lytic murein transglycosylase D
MRAFSSPKLLSLLAICFIWILKVDPIFSQESNHESIFTQPLELNDSISFWKSVYTKINSTEGYLHDSENLNIVYGVFPANENTLQNYRNQIIQDLTILASGQRSNLSRNQTLIFEIWGKSIDNKTYLSAIDRLRFQRGQSDAFLSGYEKSKSYDSFNQNILKRRNIPPELFLIPHLESSFNPQAISSANAVGMWQFTKNTGQQYLRVDDVIDERLDPYLSTQAAISLLQFNYDQLGSWPLAITAYNHGLTGILNAKNILQTSSISEIINNYKGSRFGFASRNFYPQFLAILDITNNFNKYFENVSLNTPIELEEFRVTSPIYFSDLSNRLNIEKDIISSNNLSLLQNIKNDRARIPQGTRLRLPASLINKENLDNVFNTIQSPINSYQSKALTENSNTDADNISITNLNDGDNWVDPKFISQNIPISIDKSITTNMPQSTENTNIEDSFIQSNQTIEEPSLMTDIVLVEASPSEDFIIDTIDLELGLLPSHGNILSYDDFEVDSLNRIYVYNETIEQIAIWLNISSSELRRYNGKNPFDKVYFGEQISLIFSEVSPEDFINKRSDYHKNIRDNFFSRYIVSGTRTHLVQRNENIEFISREQYKSPMWLLKAYNPSLSMDNIFVGQTLIIPIIEQL